MGKPRAALAEPASAATAKMAPARTAVTASQFADDEAATPPEPLDNAPGARLWIVAAIVAASLHAGLVWVAMNWPSSPAAPGEPPPAVMIDLAPLSVAEATPQEVAPAPDTSEAQPEPEPEPAEQPVAEAAPEPTPEPPLLEAEPVAERNPVDAPAPPEPAPPTPIADLPPVEKAGAVLAPPPPAPVTKPLPPAPKASKTPPPAKQEVERRKPPKPERPQKPRQTQMAAPPSAPVRRSERSAAPSAAAGSTSSESAASWKGALVAHLNRFKRFPPGATSAGTASIAFTISRSGQVLSARLTGSSGDSALDQEAASLPRRASPMPAPPSGFGGGGAITLTVPVRFNRI